MRCHDAGQPAVKKDVLGPLRAELVSVPGRKQSGVGHCRRLTGWQEPGTDEAGLRKDQVRHPTCVKHEEDADTPARKQDGFVQAMREYTGGQSSSVSNKQRHPTGVQRLGGFPATGRGGTPGLRGAAGRRGRGSRPARRSSRSRASRHGLRRRAASWRRRAMRRHAPLDRRCIEQAQRSTVQPLEPRRGPTRNPSLSVSAGDGCRGCLPTRAWQARCRWGRGGSRGAP